MAKQIELVFPEKQPLSELDYSLDISSEIFEPGDDVTSVSALIKPSGAGELTVGRLGNGPSLYVVKDTDPDVGTPRWVIVAWLKDGVAGRGSYTLRLLVTLASGRELDILCLVPISGVLAASPVCDPPSTDFSQAVTWNGAPPHFYNLSATVLAVASASIAGSVKVTARAT